MIGFEKAGKVPDDQSVEYVCETYRNELPEEYRIIENVAEDAAYIEREVSEGERWVAIFEVNHPNAAWEWADELAEHFDDDSDVRVVFDYSVGSSGKWLVEERKTEEESE